MVMATQNPLESYGTFPLPEAQTDRFFMRLSLGYMTRRQELSVIARTSAIDIVNALEQTVTDEETTFIRRNYRETLVNSDVSDYIMDIIEATRNESRFIAGASTRGAIALYRASQACAALNGRDYVIPEDVRFVAPHVLAHRLSMGATAKSEQLAETLHGIINKASVPIEEV
jgi:MoxR-like ATPase